MTPQATTETAFSLRPRRLPKMKLIRKPRSGKTGMSQTSFSIGCQVSIVAFGNDGRRATSNLVFEQINFVNRYGFAVAEERDNNTQTDCGFGRRDDDNEDRKHGSGKRICCHSFGLERRLIQLK